ncbi:MAG: hydroxyacid dehydrogenase [Anaerolineales bacterium]|nr:hydroxyacid dehydrogenase [Chloroflexota bacterium]MBL6979553.1 hydroxyacid dehydrogenase [Anaerolineales bacterium]
MAQMKILITDNFTENGIESLSASADVDYQPGMAPDDLLDCISAYDALIVRGRTKVNADVIVAASKLKVIGRAGVGVDNIDLASAQSRNITVVNTPTANTIAVAEHTLALIFALVRSVAQGDAAMKSGRWIKDDIVSTEMGGKVLGIVGLGNIGSAVAQRAAGFGLKVIAHDPKKTDEFLSRHSAESVTLADLYSRADIISLHVPLSPKTQHMINGQAFAQMKRGVYLICTARGGIINETALLSALETGQVAGAALDVFAQEPPGLTAVVSHPKVIATPHIAAQTHQAQIRAAADIADEVLAALRGEPLRWKIV